MKRMFDYAGNEIHEGDEIVIIKVIDRQFFRAGILIPASISKTGNDEHILERKVPDSECFEIGESIKVIVQEETMNELGYCKIIKNGNGITFTCYNTIQIMNLFSHNTTMLTIKGISDTEEYYKIWKQKTLIK